MSVWRIQQHNAAQSWCFVFNLNLIRDHFVAKLWSFLFQLILRWLQLSCSQLVRGSMGTVMKGRDHYVILSIFTRYFIGVCEPRFVAKLYQWERQDFPFLGEAGSLQLQLTARLLDLFLFASMHTDDVQWLILNGTIFHTPLCALQGMSILSFMPLYTVPERAGERSHIYFNVFQKPSRPRGSHWYHNSSLLAVGGHMD